MPPTASAQRIFKVWPDGASVIFVELRERVRGRVPELLNNTEMREFADRNMRAH